MGRSPVVLVDPGWLASHLEDPGVRTFDCTVELQVSGANCDRYPDPLESASGRPTWLSSRIPGSGFLDLLDVSDASQGFRFAPLEPRARAARLAAMGIDQDTTVLLYDRDQSVWAARAAMLLVEVGHPRVAILDGGWEGWRASGGAVASTTASPPPGTMQFRAGPVRFVEKDDVLRRLGDVSCLLVNCLSPAQYTGEAGIAYTRAGRIPNSVNLHVRGLLADGRFPHGSTLSQIAAAVRAYAPRLIITYCGVGIAASAGAVILQLAGFERVAVYAGSLSEWNADRRLPLEQGAPRQRGGHLGPRPRSRPGG